MKTYLFDPSVLDSRILTAIVRFLFQPYANLEADAAARAANIARLQDWEQMALETGDLQEAAFIAQANQSYALATRTPIGAPEMRPGGSPKRAHK